MFYYVLNIRMTVQSLSNFCVADNSEWLFHLPSLVHFLSEKKNEEKQTTISGFVRLRKNLENLEKGTFWKRIRENLENSGNSLTIFTTSGKTQGILFCQTSLIK